MAPALGSHRRIKRPAHDGRPLQDGRNDRLMDGARREIVVAPFLRFSNMTRPSCPLNRHVRLDMYAKSRIMDISSGAAHSAIFRQPCRHAHCHVHRILGRTFRAPPSDLRAWQPQPMLFAVAKPTIPHGYRFLTHCAYLAADFNWRVIQRLPLLHKTTVQGSWLHHSRRRHQL